MSSGGIRGSQLPAYLYERCESQGGWSEWPFTMPPSLDRSATARRPGMTGDQPSTPRQRHQVDCCVYCHLLTPYLSDGSLPRTVPKASDPDLGKVHGLSLTYHSPASHVGESDFPSWSWSWRRTHAHQRTLSFWTCILHLGNTGSCRGTKLSVRSNWKREDRAFEQLYPFVSRVCIPDWR